MFYVVVAAVNVLSTRSRCIFNAGQKSNIVVSETREDEKEEKEEEEEEGEEEEEEEEEERQQQQQQQQRANPEASQIKHKPEY